MVDEWGQCGAATKQNERNCLTLETGDAALMAREEKR
jgi:hypothetical protein